MISRKKITSTTGINTISCDFMG